MDWFAADKDGLARLVQRRGMAWALFEVVQNGLDQNVTKVSVELKPIPNTAQVLLSCEDDDPDGFENLSLAWTLFADTGKRSDPTKAGRFTMGEKMVLAMAHEATIASTTGTVTFNKSGRHLSKARRERGSRIEVRLPMTRAEYQEVCLEAQRIIPKPGVTLLFNGEPLQTRNPLKSFGCELQTEFADQDRVLRRTRRKTVVTLYKPGPGETPTLYELGLPVVHLEEGLDWHVNVHQRVPLNVDRDNVTPAYMREICVNVVNEMHSYIKKEDAAKPAIQDALADPRINVEAVTTVMMHQFGEKRAVYDPSDPEANNRLISEGYTVIPGGTFSKDAWKNIRESGAAIPSGKISPTPKPYSNDPNAKAARFIPEEKWTKGMKNLAQYAHELGWLLIHEAIDVQFETGRMTDFWAANFGNGGLVFNHDRLGKDWFERAPNERVNDLLIHEFGHHYSGNHLDEAYFKGLTYLGAKMVHLALRNPDFFRKFGYTDDK